MSRQLVIKQQDGTTLVIRLTAGNQLEVIKQKLDGSGWNSPAGFGGSTQWADLTAAQLSGTIGGAGLAGRVELFGFNGVGQVLVIAQLTANGAWPAAPQNLG